MNLLTIETTCDETAAAVVTDTLQVLSSVTASQDALHERFGGVVPEIASRAHVERILPVIDEALRKARLKLDQIDAVAVAQTPGLAGSLLIGMAAAKAICVARQIPLIAFNHLQAHVYACRLACGDEVFPCVGMVVSGGHTSMYRCRDACDFELLGTTIDDAAGEAFDKVASMLGLAYPGGPSIEAAAREGRADAVAFPRPFLRDSRLDFSFSGLKTAVRYHLVPPGSEQSYEKELDRRLVCDVAASFQEAVVDCLVGKAEQALEKTGMNTLAVGGGVVANRRLRDRLGQSAAERGYRLYYPPMRLCTDNAVMGAIAVERWKAGLTAPLDISVVPGPRPQIG
jgi:N6-L-threonylcarbamoyladenine synthase